MMKWAGRNVYEKMWKPLLVGKFGPFYRDVNMAWMWARIKARTTRLGPFEGGFQNFASLFGEKLRGMEIKIRLGAKVESIKREQGQLWVRSDGKSEAYDQVLVTTSPNLLAKLSPDLPENYLKGLLALKSMGAVVMVLALRQQLSKEGYYWFNLPKEAGFPMLALVEHTNFVPADKFGGDRIVYAGDYLVPGDEYFSLGDAELLERFAPAFKRINPAFELDWVRKVWVFKTQGSRIPVSSFRFLHLTPWILEPSNPYS